MRTTVLILLLAAALLCYLLGFFLGAVALLILGGLAELGFWLGLFGRFRKNRDQKQA